MGKLRKIGKKIGRGIKKVGRKLKKGFGKIAKAFGKLGPLGTIALSFIVPGIGGWISNLAQGTSFLQPLAQGIVNAGNFVKNGVGQVFNRVTDAIEHGMNAVSKPFMQDKTARGAGSAFRDWVSSTTNGFIEPSTKNIEPIVSPAQTITRANPDGTTFNIEVPETTISAEAQVGIGGPEMPPPPPKNMTDPVYVQGSGIEGETLKTGYYEAADLDKYYRGIDTPVGLGFEPGVDVAGANIPGQVGPPKPIKAVDRATIKTSEGVPIPKGSANYFSRSRRAYKTLQPVAKVGQDIQAQKDLEDYQIEQNRIARREHFSAAGMDLLATGTASPNTSYIDFSNNNPTNEQLINLQNAYSGILS